MTVAGQKTKNKRAQKMTENANIIEKTPQVKRYPKIGLALGSGAAKAVCQLGVLKTLIEHNIKIGHIMGSSMGAIVGGVYALGLDIDDTISKCVNYAEQLKIKDFGNLNIFHESLFNKRYTKNLLKEIFGDATFADCKTPFSCTAVDLESGQEVLLNTGYLWEAIRASTSIPGVFAPVFLNGSYLTDGGMLEDTPLLSLRRNTDCDLIIGASIVDLKSKQFLSGAIYQRFYQKPKHINLIKYHWSKFINGIKLFATVLGRTINILREELFKYILLEAKPDILLKITIDDVSIFDFNKARELVKIGEKAMTEHLPELLLAIEKKSNQLNDEGKDVNLGLHNDGGWSNS